MRLFPKAGLPIAGVVAAVALAGGAFAKEAPAAPMADPPAVLGEAYVLDGATVTPADAPFDDVGLAALDAEAGAGITIAHRTLPLPSYVEVTALDSGRTILARVERRGPLAGPAFVALSSGAFAQIGADPAEPLGVRVRRVSPQEYERSLLRTGQRAPERLATPKSLLEVLRRRLAAKATTPGLPVQPAAQVIEAVELPHSDPSSVIEAAAVKAAPKVVTPKAAPSEAPAATPKPPAAKPRAAGSFTVQVGAFASRANADATAKKLGGNVSVAGKLWRVRTGPYATRAEANSAQAKAAKAGFAGAQIISASPAK